jgi:hypothetical protein
MSTSRPFAYNNTGSPIAGTEQVGSLAVGYPSGGFSGFEWWNGPDENLGYVIACSVPGDTQPTPVAGVDASVGFFRSGALTESSFISLANVIAGPSGPFASGSTAKTWLNSNGYWTSYAGSTGATGGAYELVILPYQPPAAGDVIFPNFAATPPPTQGNTNPNIFATGGVYWNQIDINSVDQTSYYNGLVGNAATISFTQNGNTAIYSASSTAIILDGAQLAFNYNPQTRPGQLTLTQASPVNFTLGETVYISYT